MKGKFKALLISFFFSILSFDEVKCEFQFLLLHTNDMHSRYEEVNQYAGPCHQQGFCFGGLARVQTAVKKYTEEARNKRMPTLYLDAGGLFGGTVFYSEYKWELAVKMMNLLQPRAMGLGESEFMDGVEGLIPFVQNVQVPIVCTNIDTSQEPRLKKIRSSIVITLGEAPNTAKIGIVGYIKNINNKQLGKVEILDQVQSLRQETHKLREQEMVNIIIALGHAGYDMDKRIALEVDNIDLIVGGQSHTFLYNGRRSPANDRIMGPYPTFVSHVNKKIPIVQAFYATKYLGYLELNVGNDWKINDCKGLPILLNGNIQEDKEVKKAIKTEADTIALRYQDKIGYTEITLRGESECKFQECNLGNMIADAFVDYVSTHYQTENGEPVLIGLIDSADIKGALYANTERGFTGVITLEDTVTVLPFGCSLEVIEMKGEVLRSVLESSMETYDLGKGLIQVSGLKLQYKLSNTKRLESVKVAPNYREIDDNSVYNVVMPEGLAHKYLQFLEDRKRVVSINKKEKDYIVVGKFIKTKKNYIKKDGEYSRLQGRICIKKYSRMKGIASRIRNKIAEWNPANGLYG